MGGYWPGVKSTWSRKGLSLKTNTRASRGAKVATFPPSNDCATAFALPAYFSAVTANTRKFLVAGEVLFSRQLWQQEIAIMRNADWTWIVYVSTLLPFTFSVSQFHLSHLAARCCRTGNNSSYIFFYVSRRRTITLFVRLCESQVRRERRLIVCSFSSFKGRPEYAPGILSSLRVPLSLA